jgi:serine phosphatase RsbU (regulator of sigma subunit)
MPPAFVAGEKGLSESAEVPEGVGGSPSDGLNDSSEPFHRLIVLAAELLCASMAAVTFRDEDGKLVDGSVGLVPPPPDAEHVIRPLCEEVISSGLPLVVSDVLRCPTYASHPEIIQVGVRGYIGVPLRLRNGPVCGSFCILDRAPRNWSEHDRGIVEGLATAVMSEMSLRVEAHRAATNWWAAERARTEAERARAKLEFLAEASIRLAESLDFKTTLDSVVQLTVPLLAHTCAVYLRTDGGWVERLVLRGDAPDRQRVLDDIARCDSYPSDHPVGPAKVVRTGQTEVVCPVTDEWLRALALDDHHLALLHQASPRTVILAPLTLHGRTLGALACARMVEGMEYSGEDIRVIEQLADRVAVALDNARLYRERDDVAQTLQRSLLPPALPQVPGLEHGVRYRPAQAEWLVCGDFYDLFQINPQDWVAVIGDVCGKGLSAAVLTGLARHVIRTVAMRDRRPREILRVLNESLLREESVGEDARFCTALCVKIRPRLRDAAVVALSSGGHPAPLVLRREGAVETVSCPGLLLGAFQKVDFKDVPIALNPGDALVMFTDGATEARRGSALFTTGRLRDLVGSCRGLGAQVIADEVAREVMGWEDGEVRDDLAILVLRNPL